MKLTKSLTYLYLSLLLLGGRTFTVTAQTIEPETASPSKREERVQAITRGELDSIPHTLEEAGWLSQSNHLELPLPISGETAQVQNPEQASSGRVLPRIGAEFTTGSGVGYNSSFGSIEGFVPLRQTLGHDLTFLEGRLLLSTENALGSSNLIVGHRSYSPDINRIFGGYIAYDYRDTGNSSFHQLGVGLETLGEVWDVRANAYFPLGDTRRLTEESVFNSATSFSNPFFLENFLAQTRTQQQQINRRFEAAMTGFDLEAGGKFLQLGETGDLRGYTGVYLYDASGSPNTWGWRVRLEARPNDNLRLGLSLSDDDIFGTNLVVSLGANFPGTRPAGVSQEETALARIAESVTRNRQIVVDEQLESESFQTQDTVFLTNPTTGQPWRFRHVNLGIGNGNGTFENPTGTLGEALAIAQPNDIVYVQLGTNPGIPAFTIPDEVQVLSTGPVQQIDTVERGNLQLPLSGTGSLPNVTETAVLGNSTTLSGFAIATTAGSGILGTDISNVIVRDNAIANTASEGILLNNVTGQVAIANNTIDNSGAEGVSINNDRGEIELNLDNTRIANNGGSSNEGDGVKLELRNDARGTFNLSNNTITDNSGLFGLADGVDIQIFDNAQGTLNLSNNQIANNQFDGVNIELEATAQGTFNITNSTISDNGSSGIDLSLSDSAQQTFTITENTIAGNLSHGIDVSFSDDTRGTLDILSNTVSDNQDNGVNIQVSDTAQGTLNIANNQEISRNGNYGIFTNTNDTALLQLLIEANSTTNNPLAGLSLNTSDSAITFAEVRSNTLTDGTFVDWEALTSNPEATICLQPSNNQIGSLLLNDFLGGQIQVEVGTLPTNNITMSNLTFWSGTTVPPGTCSVSTD